MKKILALILTIAMAAMLFTGCAGTTVVIGECTCPCVTEDAAPAPAETTPTETTPAPVEDDDMEDDDDGESEGILNALALDKLGSHRRGSDCSAAAERLELAICDNIVLVDLEIYLHNIAALCIADNANALRVINLTNVSGIGEMIHNLFTI